MHILSNLRNHQKKLSSFCSGINLIYFKRVSIEEALFFYLSRARLFSKIFNKSNAIWVFVHFYAGIKIFEADFAQGIYIFDLCGGLGLSAICLSIAALYTGLLLKGAAQNRFFSVLYHKIFHLSSNETYSGLPHKGCRLGARACPLPPVKLLCKPIGTQVLGKYRDEEGSNNWEKKSYKRVPVGAPGIRWSYMVMRFRDLLRGR